MIIVVVSMCSMRVMITSVVDGRLICLRRDSAIGGWWSLGPGRGVAWVSMVVVFVMARWGVVIVMVVLIMVGRTVVIVVSFMVVVLMSIMMMGYIVLEGGKLLAALVQFQRRFG